jgi:hypothetical protein
MPGDEDLEAELARLRAENESLKRRAQRRSSPTRRSPPSTGAPVPTEPARSSRADQPIDLMIEALGLEIAEIKKKGGSTSIDLVGGVLISSSNGRHIYQFPFTDSISLSDETPIKIRFGELEASGSIVSVRDGTIVLRLDEHLGPRLPRVRLIADDSFLMERLVERLQQVKSKQAVFNFEAGLRILGASPIKTLKTYVM